MFSSSLAFPAIFAALNAVYALPLESNTLSTRQTLNLQALAVCGKIARTISKQSQVFSGASDMYIDLSEHWLTSSNQIAACVVMPTTNEDLSTILQIVADNRIPFAVQSGGHTSNPGFSSTNGVHISLKGFQQVQLSADKSTCTIGAGNIWDNVYSALDQTGVNVVGGRVTGVGVGGFMFSGGGFSWHTNKYGLAVDQLISATMVLPNATITTVTAESDPDLFFAIKGGGNAFGVITSFTVKTIPQLNTIWGGLRIYSWNQLDKIAQATADFQANNVDPDASIITTYNSLGGITTVELLMFYNGGATPPPSTFAAFNAIDHMYQNVAPKSFRDVILSAPSNATSGYRGAFATVPLRSFSVPLIQQIVNLTHVYGRTDGHPWVSFDVESFIPNMFTNSPPSAWPHAADQGFLPLNIYFSWLRPRNDDKWRAAMKDCVDIITAQAIAEGQDLEGAVSYPNYALSDTPMQQLFGNNLPRLRELKQRYDPNGVMDLAGGYKF